MKSYLITIILSATLCCVASAKNINATAHPVAEMNLSDDLLANEEYKTEVAREFPVSANPKLSIDNKYGNIRIIEGTENKIMFKIEITGKGRTQTLAKEYAESVSIDFSQDGNSVSATTRLANLSCNNCGRTIHYTVVAPRSVAMTLSNKYGNINLDNAVNPVKLDVKYGDISAGSLAEASIDIKYGNTGIRSCTNATVDCKYSKLRIDEAKTLRIDSKYDEINIGTVTDIRIETGYTNVRIDKLNKRIAAEIAYGKLNIEEIPVDFSEISVEAKYTNVTLPLDSRHSFKASLQTRYGDIQADKLTLNNVSLKKGSSLTGNVGSVASPSATVTVDASYGNIIFK
jgi:hypothetical protein